jgi:tRNA nucleotidyltransferase (CCA-adding enzyme)
VEIIVSHISPDFDALGAMVGARRLHPEGRIVLTGGLDRGVREFMTLHEEFLGTCEPREVDPEAVTRLVVVDTQSSERLGEIAAIARRPEVEVIVYDHHTNAVSDLRTTERHVRETGAVTTLLVEAIRARKLPITPIEATTMLLGIYQDTGSLLYAGTTPEDVEAAAFLLRSGARLEVCAAFLRGALTKEQRRLLNRLLAATEYPTIDGVTIAIALAPEGPYVAELAVLANKLADLVNAGVVFVLAAMESAVHVVGRARSDAVDVAEVLTTLGGGGHARAASAVLKDLDLHSARDRVLAALEGRVFREATARAIMSTPPRFVRPESSVAQAYRQMVRYRHSGLCVLEHGKLVGIITRRDVDRARHHRLAHAPVKGFMTRDVVTARPETPVSGLEARMLEHDVGRLPIVEDDRVIGVVTRSDLLRALHGARYAEVPATRDPRTTRELLTDRLPARIQRLLGEIGAAATELDLEAYVVGGFVRDLLLGVRNLDVDVLVDRDAELLAAEVARRLHGTVTRHARFGTAKLLLPHGQKADGPLPVDFGSARTESYARPGALPEVEGSSVTMDLRRRDFTFNAMAVRINPDGFGHLLDPYGGERDLERRVVRVLHNLSFVEDPTRIFRAVRFETRYHFRMNRHTEELARAAIRSGALASISPERMRREFYYCFQEPAPVGCLRRLDALGVLEWLHPGLTLDPDLLTRADGAARWVTRLVTRGRRKNGATPRATTTRGSRTPAPRPTRDAEEEEHTAEVAGRLDRRVVYLAAMCASLSLPDAESLLRERLRVQEPIVERVLAALRKADRVAERLAATERTPSDIYRLLEGLPMEVLAFARARSMEPAVEKGLEKFLTELRDLRPLVTGSDLIGRGHRPGPRMGAALRKAFEAQLNGEATTREEALAVAEAVMSDG